MKRVIAVTALNNFVSGALALIVPLLLLEKNVSVAEIGIVLSIMPLVFLSARLLFAALADHVGWGPIFLLLNWPGTLISTVIYFLANSVTAFSLGKLAEGIKESAYWAVNRTAIFSLAPNKREKEATRINGVIWLSTAIGSAAAGLGIAYVGFTSALGILIIASAIMGIPAALLWKPRKIAPKPKAKASSPMALLDPRGRDRMFWWVSVTLLFYSLATYPLITLLLPIFMEAQLRYSYLSIGAAFLLYNLLAALVTLVTLRTPLNAVRVIAQSIVGLVATVLLANSGFYFLALFFALAAIRGLGIGFFESVIAKVTKDTPNVSVDIGFLHVPTRLAEFASVLTAGFIAQSLGYAPVFAITGIFFAAFSVSSFHVLRTK
jgi:MFS family permease